MEGDRRRLTDLLGHLALGLMAGGFALRVFAHGGGTSLSVDLLTDTLFWIAGAAWAARAAAEGRLRVWTTGLEAPLILYAIVAGASPLVAAHKLPAFSRATPVVSSVLLYLLVVNLPDRRRALSVALALLAGAALTNVVYGFHQRFWMLPALRRLYPPGVPIEGVEPEHEQEVRWRMETDEATGTFFLSNTLAGFLVLLLPAAVGLAMSAWRRDARKDAVAWTVVTGGLAAGIWSTGSLGGWFAAAAALMSYGVFFLWRHRPALRGPLLGIAALALLAAGIGWIAGGISGARLRALHPSIAFRLDYWKAALQVVDEAPLLGVGLDNFGDAYTRYKAPAAQETTRVHNAFLEAWAETGLVGLVLFLSIWIVFLLRSLRIPAEAGRPPPRAATSGDGGGGATRGSRAAVSAGFVLGAGVAIVLSSGIQVEGASLVLAVTVVACGLLAGWVAGRPLDPAVAAPALAAGVTGFLLHAAIDIDWAVPAMTQSSLLLLAAWACATEPDPPRPAVDVLLGPVGRVFAILPFVVAALVFAGFLVPQARRAEELGDQARSEFDLARRASIAWRDAADEAARGAAAQQVRDRFRAATGLLMDAQAANPWNATLFRNLALYSAAVYPTLEREGGMASEVEFEVARKAIDDAIALAPESAGLRAQKGELWRMRADFLAARLEKESDAGRRDRQERHLRGAVSSALAAYDEAVERYPTNAWYRFLRGQVLDRLGRVPEACADLRRSLALHALQDIDRLRLPPDIEAKVRQRLKDLEREESGGRGK